MFWKNAIIFFDRLIVGKEEFEPRMSLLETPQGANQLDYKALVVKHYYIRMINSLPQKKKKMINSMMSYQTDS